MADNALYNAATDAERQTLKYAAIRLDKAVNTSRDGGIEADTKAPNVDVDAVGAAAAAALSAMGISGNASTDATVSNAAAVTVVNSAGTTVTTTGVAEVADSALTDVKLPATVAGIASGATLTGITPSGTYTDTVTFTVAGGVITAIALS